MKRQKKKKEENFISVVIYGIFRPPNQILKVSLSEEEMELEMGLGSYGDDCLIVKLSIVLMD